MDSDTGSPEVGRHLLGAHVVGQRVVVRRVLRGVTGPSGGPAMTDVLGVCTSWGQGRCVVESDRGPVVIEIADIVSGKPVPPRPSARLRVAAADAQRRALALWPDLVTEPRGDWILRLSDSSTARRANSVLAIGESGLADPVAEVTSYYLGHDRRPIAAVVADSAQCELFASRGWVPESHDADTLFQIAPVARALRTLRGHGADQVLLEEDRDLVTVSIGDPGAPVATGVAACAEDWVGFRGIEVVPAYRRQGLGLAVMAILLEWGAERGATTAYLQVLGHNTGAIALYERIGFATHHAYRYLAPPAPD
ncbi:GNAT family N-acetyltransferase [Nocardioides sp.]|uniref:GNAT family N-acetyltransferase n=1 Tax=Nocardioides sp. TaxID=35761 RepID=UPI003D0BA741